MFNSLSTQHQRAAIAGMVLFGIVFAGWAALVPIPQTVVAQGVIRPESGWRYAAAVEAGVVNELMAEEGDLVKAGKTIARLQIPELENRIARKERELDNLMNQYKADRDFLKGLSVFEQTTIGDPSSPDELKAKMIESRNAAEALEKSIEIDRQSLEYLSLVKSPIAGRVFVRAMEGERVARNETVFLVEPVDEPVVVMAFLPQEAGIPSKGSLALVSPASLDPNEYGFMTGKVRSVGISPQSAERIRRYVANADIVESIMSRGIPIEITIELDRADTPNGFAWTIGDGPGFPISTGMLCTSEVTRKESTFLQMIFPTLSGS